MNYQQLLQKVAKEFQTTPEEVEKEMRKALVESGILMSPRAFIALASAKIKKDYKS